MCDQMLLAALGYHRGLGKLLRVAEAVARPDKEIEEIVNAKW
jgi:hypothetical protein